MNSNAAHAPDGEYVGLDVGEKRIGVARIHSLVKIAEPLPAIAAEQSSTIEEILKVAQEREANGIVVGLPRGLDGQETAQTMYCKQFAQTLAGQSDIPIYIIDEAGSTKAAEERTQSYPDASIDSLAASVFLEDFIQLKDISALTVN